MQAMDTIRHWQIDQLRKDMAVLGHIVKHTSQEDATTYRDGGEGWTALEALCHLRDFEAVFFERAQITLAQAMGDLPFPDHEALVTEKNYNAQSLDVVYTEWAQTRREYIEFLQGISGDDTWEKPGKHPTRGPFTLNDQLFLTVWHDTNHIEQIVRTLDEKQSGS